MVTAGQNQVYLFGALDKKKDASSPLAKTSPRSALTSEGIAVPAEGRLLISSYLVCEKVNPPLYGY